MTFFHLPPGLTQERLFADHADLFDRVQTKKRFSVDAYFVGLNTPPENLVGQSAYWYGLWSHRRGGLWKGFLQIDLSPADDAAARAQIDADRQAEDAS